jgi:hypothetical protein
MAQVPGWNCQGNPQSGQMTGHQLKTVLKHVPFFKMVVGSIANQR